MIDTFGLAVSGSILPSVYVIMGHNTEAEEAKI